MLKTVVLLNIFVMHLKQIFNTNGFTFMFDQFNAFLLNKSINFLKKKKRVRLM